jgi:hypothetical protein
MRHFPFPAGGSPLPVVQIIIPVLTKVKYDLIKGSQDTVSDVHNYWKCS